MKILLALYVCQFGFCLFPVTQNRKSDHVTLDGMRWQEVFGE
jgi:hypothetical protein